LAAGSAFTNGLPRLLPGPMHVPPAFFLPQFVPVVLLVFWMIRVRFTGWFEREAAVESARELTSDATRAKLRASAIHAASQEEEAVQ
jgi:hypothetical protein